MFIRKWENKWDDEREGKSEKEDLSYWGGYCQEEKRVR